MRRRLAATVARVVVLFAVVLLAVAPSSVRASTLDDAMREIVGVAEAEQRERPLASVALAVRFRGETRAAAIGLADVERGVLATPETVYRIASVTKTMTATSVMLLAEQGRLSLDDDVRRHVPAFAKKPHVVTVRHLLGNLGGVSNYKNCAVECHDKAPKTTTEALAVFSSWPLEAVPGERYVYTTYGFNLLGAVVESASKKSYDAFLREDLSRRAGLTMTRVDRGPRDAARAKGYRVKDGALVPSELIDVTGRFAGGGVISTVHDLVAFGDALMHGRIVDDRNFARMSSSMATADGRLTKYGMGMASYPLAGRRVVGHAGGQPETSSLLLMYPGHDLVIAIVTNTEDQWPALYAVAGRAAEVLLQGGERRRGVAARTPADTFFVEAVSLAYTYGFAAYEMGERPATLGEVVVAARATRALLAEAARVDDGASLARALTLAVGPRDGAPLVVMGAYAAGVIESAFGRAALEALHLEGPLVFWRRFEEACRVVDCPSGVRLDDGHLSRVVALDDAWRAAAGDDVRALRVGRDTDLDALAARLVPRFREARAMPDLGDELIDESARARAAGDVARADRALALAEALSPTSGKVHFALGEERLRGGRIDDGRAALATARALPGAHERFAPERAKPLAQKLEKSDGGRDAAAALLEEACLALPDERALFEALARVHAKRGDESGAKRARAAAEALLRAERLRSSAPSRKTR